MPNSKQQELLRVFFSCFLTCLKTALDFMYLDYIDWLCVVKCTYKYYLRVVIPKTCHLPPLGVLKKLAQCPKDSREANWDICITSSLWECTKPVLGVTNKDCTEAQCLYSSQLSVSLEALLYITVKVLALASSPFTINSHPALLPVTPTSTQAHCTKDYPWITDVTHLD